MITEAALGGDILTFVVASATQGFAILSDASFNHRLVAFNPETGALVATMLTRSFPDGLALDLLVVGDHLFVGDRSVTSPGVRVYDVDTRAAVTGLIPVGLPPNELEFLDDAPLEVGLPPRAAPGHARFVDVAPNPLRAGRGVVRLETPWAASPGLVVYDVTGREVADLGRWNLSPGLNRIPVDLPLAPGTYWVKAVGMAIPAIRFQAAP
jgi:hypothetical protein